MKHIFTAVLFACLLSLIMGCFDDDYDSKSKELRFENASRFTVSVIPLTTEWEGFAMGPGEIVKLKDIRNVDFRYEPTSKVREGSASTKRYIVFVDAPPSSD